MMGLMWVFFFGVYVPAARVSTCKRILKIEKHTPIPALWPMRVCRNVSRSALEPSSCSTFNYNEATVRVTKKEQKRGFHQLSRKTLGHSLSAVRFDILPIQYKPWWNIRNLFMNWGHFLGWFLETGNSSMTNCRREPAYQQQSFNFYIIHISQKHSLVFFRRQHPWHPGSEATGDPKGIQRKLGFFS